MTDETQQALPPPQMSKEREIAAIERAREQDNTTFDAITGVFSNGRAFQLAMKMAERMAGSTFLPAAYTDNPDNCLVLIDYSARLKISPIALAPQMPIVKGKPTLQGSILIALINSSGKFATELDYEWCGPEIVPGKPIDNNTGLRAYATRKSDGKVLYGAWVTWKMAVDEGWVNKDGSKWKTMPEQMFLYRASSFFSRVWASDVTFGMYTSDELEDVIEGDSVRVTQADSLNAKLDDLARDGAREERGAGTVVDAEFTDVRDADPPKTDEKAPPAAEPAPGPKRRSARKPPETAPAQEAGEAPAPLPLADTPQDAQPAKSEPATDFNLE